MKKTLLAVAIIAALVTAAPPTFATGVGIPTLDIGAAIQLVMNATQQAAEALAALNTAKDAIAQAKSQYESIRDMTSGNDRLGDFLNDPSLNLVSPMGDWTQVYGETDQIDSLRDRYGLRSNNPAVQSRFDGMLARTNALERNYNASNERVKNAEQLRQQLNVVQTPQQKQDLQLRYQQELLEQQNQQMRMDNTQRLMDQKQKMEDRQHIESFVEYMKGNSTILPKYN